MAAELALEIVLPELGEPNISPVVVQRPADKIAIKPWERSIQVILLLCCVLLCCAWLQLLYDSID